MPPAATGISETQEAETLEPVEAAAVVEAAAAAAVAER
jgi:hypothetical protein